MKKLVSLLFVIVILVTTTMTAFAQSNIIGDTDLDGEITIIDATKIQHHLASLTTLSTEALELADVDADENVSIFDCTMIQRFIAKLIDSFPAQVKPTEPETQAPTQAETTAPNSPSEYELEVFRLVNVEREKAGLEPLEFGYFIYDCATLRAQECDSYFSHTRPDESEYFTVYKELGITQQWSALGENIARGHARAEDVMDSWMNSPTHKANILYDKFKYVAIGSCECSQQKGTYCTVQLFWG